MIYNWKTNPYFTPTAYVAVSGSDLNDGTAQKPYRTLQKCKDAGKGLIQVSTGVYRELPSFNAMTPVGVYIFGDGIVEIDGLFITGVLVSGGNAQLAAFNLKLKNLTVNNANNLRRNSINTSHYNLSISGASLAGTGISRNNTYIGFTSKHTLAPSDTIGDLNASFHKCILTAAASTLYIKYNIFYECDIEITGDVPFIYDLFYNCRFKLGSDTVYTYLTGSTYEEKLSNLRSRWATKFPTSTYTFANCSVLDPLFNNVLNNDFTLQPLSPARHMTYDGTFIGAFDVAYKIKPYATDLGNANGFYNASKGANILSSDTKLSLARNPDGSSVGGGAILSKPQDLNYTYELRTILAAQQLADRNRECIDTNADIDMASPIMPGTAITVDETYVVEGGSVIYNSITYSTRSKFIAVTGQTAFTSADGGYLFRVLEAPNRATVEARLKQTIAGTVISAGTDLTVNNWYKVVNNSITWNSLTVPVGDSFQAIAGQLTFTGTGGCVEIFADSDTWMEFEIGEKPTAKRVGNVASGAIDVGTDGKPLTNGHKEFYTTANKARTSLAIFARYIQYRLTFQNKMLK